MNVYAIAFLVGLAISICLTPPLILFAKRIGHIAYPSPRGWHKTPTPLLGGVALLVSFLAGLAVSGQMTSQLKPLVVGSILSFALGLADDFYHLKPLTKFLSQLGIAILLFYHHPIAIGFVVVLMNSFNLLDNLDGLAAGVAMIIALGLACFGLLFQQQPMVLTCLTLAGASAGFLVYNFHPAKIFMGDAGSLLLGFVLSAQSSILLVGSSLHLLILTLLVALPLLDTLFVICSRLRVGKSIAVGGQDHLSHWFLSRGFSPRQAVIALYSFTFFFNIAALWIAATFLSS